MLKGFKNFLMQGDLIAIAVGLVVALAFSTLILAFTSNIITPLVNAAAGGGATGQGLGWTINGQRIDLGAFISAIIYFVIFMAVICFVLVVPYRAYMRRRGVAVFQPHLFSRAQLQGDALGIALAAADQNSGKRVSPIFQCRFANGIRQFLHLRDKGFVGKTYAATVETETWTPFEDGSARIDQIIYVARESQKPIVLGKGGQRIKAIGAAARAEMERIFGHRVHLFLRVKVEAWEERRERYKALGLEVEV